MIAWRYAQNNLVMEIILKFIKEVIVGLFGKLVSSIINRSNEPKGVEPQNEIQTLAISNDTGEHLQKTNTSSNYSQQLAERLSSSMNMMQLNHKKLTHSKICDSLNYESVSKVEGYFLGRAEAPREFLESYCNFYGIDYQWIRHGEKNPFELLSFHASRAMEYRDKILDLGTSSIFYIRSKSENGDSGIVLKLSEFKYIVLPSTFHISSYVGGEGGKQIVSFYELIKSLTSNFSFFHTFGLVLPEDEFNQLFSGKIYPGKIFESNSLCLHWWDDLLDIYHKFPISKNYENMYGEEFIKAQDIIRRALEQQESA